jgi:hypothetical protein
VREREERKREGDASLEHRKKPKEEEKLAPLLFPSSLSLSFS